MKIITALLVFAVNFLIGFIMLAFMLITLNGFRESEANYAFTVFIFGGLVVAIGASLSAVFLLHYLQKKNWNQFLASGLAFVIFSVLGFVLDIFVFILGIAAASNARNAG